MRIISGYLKGRKINQPDDINTRPLKDLTKESIFNILQHSNLFSQEFKNSIILDLFSGVGSFGLECLSRGASFVTFIENYNEVLPILKKNISNLNYQNKSLTIEKNVFSALNFKKFKKKFDIIFIDPPYKEENLLPLLKNIITSNMLNNSGIIVIHRHKKESEKYPSIFKVIEEKKYGISKVIFGNYF